jgi:hypothetical protein
VVGTDLIRNQFDPDLWVKLGMRKVRELLMQGKSVVISDTRYPNEAEAVKFIGGFLMDIHRVGREVRKDTHESENALNDWEFDFRVQAYDGDLPTLMKKVDEIMGSIETNAFEEE